MKGTVAWTYVPAFVEVVRQGSFTKAASVLELPKSTVSRHVSRLEAALEVALLVRTTRSLRLTEEGERFFARVSRALDAVDEAATTLANERDEPTGTLRMTVPSDVELLPPILASFLAAQPGLRVDINVTGELVDLVAAGFDLAIRAGRLRDSALIARKVVSVDFGIFAARSYLARHPAPRRVEDLEGHECVLFRPQRGVSTWRLVGPEGELQVEVRGRFAVDDLQFARGAVVAGVGPGLLPESMFDRATDDVVRLLPDYAMPAGSLHVVYPPGPHVPAKVRAFRDHLIKAHSDSTREPL